jgi:ribonucleotide monophosphatase NagD (HAD superfamily)
MLEEAYQQARQNRVIILDQEGVIPMKNGEPTAEAVEALNKLSQNP